MKVPLEHADEKMITNIYGKLHARVVVDECLTLTFGKNFDTNRPQKVHEL